jgi:hypothetical protein
MKSKARTRRKRVLGDAAGNGLGGKELLQQVETKQKESEGSMAVNDDGEGWTDDEETIEKEVERINRLPLSTLKDIISSRVPTFTFSSKDG